MNDDQPSYEVVWPQSPRRGTQRPVSARLSTLAGRRIAFVWDYMFRGEEIFPVIARELQARFPGVEIVNYDEFGNIHGHDEAKIVSGLGDALKERQVDAVICGNGC